jgi:hypothetical protein
MCEIRGRRANTRSVRARASDSAFPRPSRGKQQPVTRVFLAAPGPVPTFPPRKFVPRARASFESVELGIFVYYVGRRTRTWRQKAGREARGECACPNSHLRASSPLARRSMAPPAPGRQPCSRGSQERLRLPLARQRRVMPSDTRTRLSRTKARQGRVGALVSHESLASSFLGCRPVRGGRHRGLFAAKRGGAIGSHSASAA